MNNDGHRKIGVGVAQCDQQGATTMPELTKPYCG